jgi:hypothetical protein
VAAAALVVIAIAALLRLAPIRSYFHGRYVCVLCGVERTVERHGIAGVPYRRKITVSDTAVFRALNSSRGRVCQHDWYLTSFGSGRGSLLGLMEQADGGTEFLVLRQLVWDAVFARDLARTAQPGETWRALCDAGRASPREMNALLGGWYEDPQRQPFAQWWARHQEQVRELGMGGVG